MADKLSKDIEQKTAYQLHKQSELKNKYPPNPPNDVCNKACLTGLLITNNFDSKIGDMNKLFETKYEKLFLWTHDQKEYSSIVIDVNPEVKKEAFWKNIGSIISLAMKYAYMFEIVPFDWFKYEWIYYFDPKKNLSDQEFNTLDELELMKLNSGLVLKTTDIGNFAPEIELMLRDDKAYTAMMMLCNSFSQHYTCLICELGYSPYHEHISKEPEIWEHAEMISDMEVAIVQACRSAEGILGEPPNKTKKNRVMEHKKQWMALIGIEPDSIFEKANMSYLDFYYKLFSDLRNPSAHSFGNINYNLERSKVVQAQCFAHNVVDGYFCKHMLSLDEAQKKLNFNLNLLSKNK